MYISDSKQKKINSYHKLSGNVFDHKSFSPFSVSALEWNLKKMEDISEGQFQLLEG